MSWDAPGWKQAALEYQHARGNHPLIAEAPLEDLAQLRRLMSDDVSLERAWEEINRAARERYNQAAKGTYEAVDYELRTYGLFTTKQAKLSAAAFGSFSRAD